MNNQILHEIVEFLKIAEKAFSYEKIFDMSGVSDVLKKMYILPKDLNNTYVSIFYKAVLFFRLTSAFSIVFSFVII